MRTTAMALAAVMLGAWAWRTAPAAVETNGSEPPRNRYGLSEPRPKTPGAIRLATYNVLNLFDHEDDASLSGEFDDAGLGTSEDRCRNMAAAIEALDADVIALQEVESLEALRWFRDTFLPDAGYEHLASRDVGYYRGVECAVMSRFPIVEVRTWPEYPLERVEREGPGWTAIPTGAEPGLRFQRSPLMVTVRVPADRAAGRAEAYDLTLFVLHHKAGGGDFRWQRESEALGVLDLAERAAGRDGTSSAARNVAILGDFNAAPWDKSFRVYLERGYVDTLSHRIIPRWANPTPTTLEEERRYKTHESDRTIDYILFNSAALREFVPGSAFVYGTLTPPDSYNWREDPHPAGYASDHYPVAVDLLPGDRK